MTDLGLRDFGSFGPANRGTEPAAPLASQPALPAATGIELPPVIIPAPPASPNRAVFAGDVPSGEDALGVAPALDLLAEVAAHRGTRTPLAIGLFGRPGAGKSFALAYLVARIHDVAAAASKAVLGPFYPRIHIQAVDVGGLDGDPALALAARIHAGLRQPYPELAREIAQAVRDPHAVLVEINEKLDAARRRLDTERRTLEESGSRLARLTETVLYESAGSQIDSYARANRARIEHRLTAFGFRGDGVRNYKDLVAAASESGGLLGLLPRALFEFKGQLRLIVWAVLLALVGFGLDVAIDTKETWLAALRNGPQFVVAAEAWMTDHIGLLAIGRKAAYVAAAFLIALNLLRAAGFLRPVFAGVRLLRADLENRRRDLGSLYAHQTKRVDILAGDVERLSRAAAEAERRAGGEGAHGGLLDPPPFEASAAAQAEGFFTSLGGLLRDDRFQAKGLAPRRIVLALDQFESVAPERARQIFATLHRIAAVSGVVVLAAADPQQLAATRADLERWVQVPLSLDARATASDYETLVTHAVGRAPAAAPKARIDPAHSLLDEPLSEREGELLGVLAPLAGGSPRAVKRLINLYALARTDSAAPRGLLALFLAVDLGGTWAERQATAALADGTPFDGEISPGLAQAISAVESFGGRPSVPEAARAATRARLFSLPI
ncbi:MAG: P-loop NTPase fold protein [Beijerinckiaceae bacterium]|nr:P-loop NTPase fold protein [Beijerinckiaceae bacterium]